jgi:hypothetical protein
MSVGGAELAALICAKCRQSMLLRDIAREAFRPRTDTFACRDCGLIEKLTWLSARINYLK